MLHCVYHDISASELLKKNSDKLAEKPKNKSPKKSGTGKTKK
jgi:hypothetical protein